MKNEIDLMILDFEEQFKLFTKIKDSKARWALKETLWVDLTKINMELDCYYEKLEKRKAQKKQ